MNKVSGLLLFILPLTISFIDLKYTAVVVCFFATFAAIQEGHFIRINKTVTKAVSGRTAINWITENTVQAITHELLYTQKSVSEISDKLNFSSLSFFGKYFERHTDISPSTFREQLGQE